MYIDIYIMNLRFHRFLDLTEMFRVTHVFLEKYRVIHSLESEGLRSFQSRASK